MNESRVPTGDEVFKYGKQEDIMDAVMLAGIRSIRLLFFLM